MHDGDGGNARISLARICMAQPLSRHNAWIMLSAYQPECSEETCKPSTCICRIHLHDFIKLKTMVKYVKVVLTSKHCGCCLLCRSRQLSFYFAFVSALYDGSSATNNVTHRLCDKLLYNRIPEVLASPQIFENSADSETRYFLRQQTIYIIINI